MSTDSTAPAIFGGGVLGYVMYDCTHYYLHHGQPSKDPAKGLKVRRNLSKMTLKLVWQLFRVLVIC